MSGTQVSTMMTFAPTMPTSTVWPSNNFYQVPHQHVQVWSVNKNSSYPATFGTPINTLLNLPIVIGTNIQPLPIFSRQDNNGLWVHEAILN